RRTSCCSVFIVSELEGAGVSDCCVSSKEEDAILPCSLSTKENIDSKVFQWKKDGQKKVFIYDAGQTNGNGLEGQNEQFRGRVFHFPDKLKVGDASIVIKRTKVTDSGNYTCDFPCLQSPRQFHVELLVGECFTETLIKINLYSDIWTITILT
uniref:Ig-like domain-containing protein n=1 Tax=Monopterus albus TaxID=43700 RepID=A0A3Q3KHC7_MONAL